MNKSKCYIAITSEPDRLGRASFTMFWLEPDGVFRPETSKHDGKPVGYRRGQCFKANPNEYIKRGAIVADSEASAMALAWRQS